MEKGKWKLLSNIAIVSFTFCLSKALPVISFAYPLRFILFTHENCIIIKVCLSTVNMLLFSTLLILIFFLKFLFKISHIVFLDFMVDYLMWSYNEMELKLLLSSRHKNCMCDTSQLAVLLHFKCLLSFQILRQYRWVFLTQMN